MKIFIVDFSETNTIADQLHSHEVFIEKKDGGAAYQQTGTLLPDLIFINYQTKPSHGRQTAESIRKRKKTSHIPIYFVGGNELENEKISGLGQAIDFAALKELVSG